MLGVLVGSGGRSSAKSESSDSLASWVGRRPSSARRWSTLFRIQVEVPSLDSGVSYAKIVERYNQSRRGLVPDLRARTRGADARTYACASPAAPGALTSTHSAVTREQTIGFADLVGYTDHSRLLSTTELATAIGRFETRMTDLVSRFGGRLVKFIGDEAMFVVDDPLTGCELALTLAERFDSDPAMPPVRVGLAAGPAVALHGDYYGEVVNLSARLVKAADPSQVMVSESLRDVVGERFAFEPGSDMALKGFDAPVVAFRLLRPAR